jgi:hypothetical protein
VDKAYRLFDIGVVDANGDDIPDVFTSNHHFRQLLLISDGKGHYRDVVSEWGLDQSREFPRAELSFVSPTVNEPGLYIYWFGTQLILRAHAISHDSRWKGTVRVNDPVTVLRNKNFSFKKTEQKSMTSETIIEFAPTGDGFLRMRPGGQGLPIEFEFANDVPIKQVYVGNGKVSPSHNTFKLAMRDRHAMAWADYNGDGVLDVFINRGALGGTLRAHSKHIQQQLQDELLMSQAKGKFSDEITNLGIRKNGCSGRHARWLDFNNDGLLDLFVNCYDRGNVVGSYTKQLYQQDNNGKLTDVAEKVGLAIPTEQIASFAWFDIDQDTDLDVVTFQDEDLRVYRNIDGYYVPEIVVVHSSEAEQRIGKHRGIDWFYDGKITIVDYDLDGDIDVFSASKRGNVLLRNDRGTLIPVDPTTIGLPEKSYTANWVDYDNDGFVDLHLVPQGLYKQKHHHYFEDTGMLEVDAEQYRAAICNWFDFDNDGRLDVLMALSEVRDFKHWWEYSPKPRGPDDWSLVGYKNVGGMSGNWLQIKVVGSEGNPQSIGAQVMLIIGKRKQTQEVGSGDGAFFSQGNYRLHFGLGQEEKIDRVTIRWPDGYRRILKNVASNQLVTVRRGNEKNPK